LVVHPEKDKPEPQVSYSTEVRPLLIENCISCHADFPLHDPSNWDLLHQHKETLETPEVFQKWVQQGSNVDIHWADLPLRTIKASSVDDLVAPGKELTKARAQCHDHPSEPWTTAQYAHLLGIFTTPYDHLEKATPPLFVKSSNEGSEKHEALLNELKEISKTAPVIEQDYLDWLAQDEGVPNQPSLVAAYSFENENLDNLASSGSRRSSRKGPPFQW